MQRNNPIVQAFYQSSAWKKVKKNYKLSQFGICERCGNPGEIVHHKKYITVNNINDSNITLDFNNLELLCRDCHNKEHFAEIPYRFDEYGNLLP